MYMGTDNKHIERCVQLVHKELDLLKNKKMGTHQLQSAKQQLIGNIALAQESKVNLMLSLGKSILLFNKVDTLAVFIKKSRASVLKRFCTLPTRFLKQSN